MYATLALVNKYFWKTLYGPIFTIVFPVLMLAILGSILRLEYVYPGIIALSVMFVGVLSMPLMLAEFKQTSLFKYVGISHLQAWRLMLAVTLYFFMIAIISTAVVVLMTLAIFSKKVLGTERIFSGLGTLAGAGSFVFSWLIHFLFASAVGILMFTFIHNGQYLATIAFAIAIPSMFLSGMIISVDIISQSSIMQWVSRFDPFRYTTGNIVVSTTPVTQIGDLFQVLSNSDKEILFGLGKSGLKISFLDNSFRPEQNNIYYLSLAPSGNLLVQYYPPVGADKVTYMVIKTSADMKNLLSAITDPRAVTPDYTLYKLLFESKANIIGSSNNVFSTDPWGVRRIPNVDLIKSFVQNFFKGESGVGDDQKRFDSIWLNIKQGNYEWLDMFFKQNTTLYTTGDRVANVVVPMVLTSAFVGVSVKKFEFKTR